MITIKRVSIESVDSQVSLFMQSSSSSDFQYEKKKWIKKHYANPAGESLIYVAINDDGEMVGITAFLKCNYFYKGILINALQVCEVSVRGDFRRQGIWERIMNYALEDIKENSNADILMAFPNYNNSYLGFKKMGWKTMLEMNNYIMTGNSKAFSKFCFKRIFFFHILFNLQHLVIDYMYMKNRDKFFVKETTRPFDGVIGDGSCAVKVDEAFLRWKEEYAKWVVKSIYVKDREVAIFAYAIDVKRNSEVANFIGIRMLEEFEDLKLEKLIACSIKYILANNPDVALIRTWGETRGVSEKAIRKVKMFRVNHHNPFVYITLNDKSSSDMFIENIKLSFFDLD